MRKDNDLFGGLRKFTEKFLGAGASGAILAIERVIKDEGFLCNFLVSFGLYDKKGQCESALVAGAQSIPERGHLNRGSGITKFDGVPVDYDLIGRTYPGTDVAPFRASNTEPRTEHSQQLVNPRFANLQDCKLLLQLLNG